MLSPLQASVLVSMARSLKKSNADLENLTLVFAQGLRFLISVRDTPQRKNCTEIPTNAALLRRPRSIGEIDYRGERGLKRALSPKLATSPWGEI